MQGAPQAQSASSSEDWRQDFKPLDEGLQTMPKLQTIPDLPEGKSANASHTDTGQDADVAVSSAQGGENTPNNASKGEALTTPMTITTSMTIIIAPCFSSRGI